MFVPTTSGEALAVALLSMCCWGSWGNSLKFSDGLIRFELFYLNFSFSVFAFALFAALTFGMLNPDTKGTFMDDWSGKSLDRYAYAFAAGLVFNVANLMLCKGIMMLGLALAFPLCIGTALVLGTLVTYAIKPSGSFPLLAAGTFIAFCAVCLASFVHKMKEEQLEAKKAETVSATPGTGSGGQISSNAVQLPGVEAGLMTAEADARAVSNAEPSFTRKVLVCVIGGVLMGLWNPLVTLAEEDPGLSAYGELTIYTFATMLSSLFLIPLILTWPLEGGASTPVSAVLSEYKDVPMKAHAWSLFGGAVWCLGTLANAVAGSSGTLSSAESYAIGQCANMIAIFWGFFFFKEFEGCAWSAPVICRCDRLYCCLGLSPTFFNASSPVNVHKVSPHAVCF